jgi:hypothetical protein
MSSSVPLQIAETVQTAHIKKNPSARHDINPSTAASRREPVTLEENSNERHPLSHFHHHGIDGIGDADEEDNLPFSVVRPKWRQSHLSTLPDLRLE